MNSFVFDVSCMICLWLGFVFIKYKIVCLLFGKRGLVKICGGFSDNKIKCRRDKVNRLK